jgi:RecB family exonuclease
MNKQPIHLTPNEARVLVRCPLHYHFLQQKPGPQADSDQAALDKTVRETIQTLHAAGGPARLSLDACLARIENQPVARQMVERYYHALARDWPRMIAGNEPMSLKIVLGRVSLLLQGTLDRLDQTTDGGILAIQFRTESGSSPTEAELRHDHDMAIYHALVAATYPLKRPVRLQELWLQTGQSVTIELSEDEYRQTLSELREPVQALSRGEVMARPGLHCERCSFKYHGCPVYAHEPEAEEEAGLDPIDPDEPDEFAPAPRRGKIPPRKWIFRI